LLVRLLAGDRERQHRDSIDEPEGDDREADRFQPEADAAEPPKHRDLDDVVEAERQHDAARRRGAARGEAAASVGSLAGEEPLPPERSKDEAGEVGDGRSDHEDDVRFLQRPARARQLPCSEEDARDSEHAERNARGVLHPAARTSHVRGTTKNATAAYWQATATITSAWKSSW